MWSGAQTPLLPPSGYNPNTWLSWKPVTISAPWPGLCCSEDAVLDIFPEPQSQTPLKNSSEVNLSIPRSQEVGSPCWPCSHLVSHPPFASPCCAGDRHWLCFLAPCQQVSGRGQEETRVVGREEEAFSLLASGPFFGSDCVLSVAPACHRSTGVPASIGWPWPLGSEEPLSL